MQHVDEMMMSTVHNFSDSYKVQLASLRLINQPRDRKATKATRKNKEMAVAEFGCSKFRALAHEAGVAAV